MRFPIVVSLAITALAGCGGNDSPATPTVVTLAPDPGFAAGTTVSIVSGETGAPVPGASLVIGGRPIAGDVGGRVTLPDRLDPNVPVDVTAAGYLDRVTRLRSREPIPLWPKRSPTGLDEHYAATLVYTSAAAGVTNAPLGGDPLFRLGSQTRQVYLVPAAELLADAAAMDALMSAAARITATAGQVAFSVTNNPPPGAVRFDVRLDPAAGTCAGARAFTSRSLRGTEIVGGSITFCSVDASRSATATHEVGHSYGLRHGPDPRDIMYPSFSSSRAVDFGPRESLAARLMLLRPPGNRWPDNDRDVAVTAARRTDIIVCRE